MKKKVLHYKKSKIANAPDILVHCINKYSDKYEACLYAESGEYLQERLIPVAAQPYFSRYDIIHFHNRSIPCNVPKLIQYHSPATPNNDPPWADLSFDGYKTVIAQYQAFLPYFKGLPLVRNIIDIYSDEYTNIAEKQGQKIRIGYSPSNVRDSTGSPEDKGYKKTVDILNAVRSKKGVDVDIIQGVSLPECLQTKRTCDILIDECVTDSYHRCTLEGLALGKMTICSIGHELNELINDLYGSRLPIEGITLDLSEKGKKILNHKTLENYLNCIIGMGMAYVRGVGKTNRAWMQKYWNPKDIVKEYENIYDQILISK